VSVRALREQRGGHVRHARQLRRIDLAAVLDVERGRDERHVLAFDDDDAQAVRERALDRARYLRRARRGGWRRRRARLLRRDGQSAQGQRDEDRQTQRAANAQIKLAHFACPPLLARTVRDLVGSL